MEQQISETRIALCVIGITANFVVLLVLMIKRKLLKAATNRYIFQLAIADFLFLCSAASKAARGFTPDEQTIDSCTAEWLIFYLNYHSSILFITVMAIDRYLAVAHSVSSFNQKIRSWRVSFTLMAVVWLISFVFSLPALIYSTVEDGAGCRIVFPIEKVNHTSVSNNVPPPCKYNDDSPGQTAYFWLEFLVMFLLPIIVICTCYGLIIRHAMTSRMRTTGRYLDHRNRRALITCIALIVVFVACWLPHHVRIFLFMKGIEIAPGSTWIKTGEFCIDFVRITTTLLIANSAINPFVYFIMVNSLHYIRQVRTRVQEIYTRSASKGREGDKGCQLNKFSSSQSRYGNIQEETASTTQTNDSDIDKTASTVAVNPAFNAADDQTKN